MVPPSLRSLTTPKKYQSFVTSILPFAHRHSQLLYLAVSDQGSIVNSSPSANKRPFPPPVSTTPHQLVPSYEFDAICHFARGVSRSSPTRMAARIGWSRSDDMDWSNLAQDYVTVRRAWDEPRHGRSGPLPFSSCPRPFARFLIHSLDPSCSPYKIDYVVRVTTYKYRYCQTAPAPLPRTPNSHSRRLVLLYL